MQHNRSIYHLQEEVFDRVNLDDSNVHDDPSVIKLMRNDIAKLQNNDIEQDTNLTNIFAGSRKFTEVEASYNFQFFGEVESEGFSLPSETQVSDRTVMILGDVFVSVDAHDCSC